MMAEYSLELTFSIPFAFHIAVVFSVILATTVTTVNVCTGATCTTTSGGKCSIICQDVNFTTKLPDGPLRNLPGTVRNLSLLVDNTNRISNPTVVIGWLPPKDVHLNVYDVYLYTWNKAVLPNVSTPHPYKYVVNTSDTAPAHKVELRVTSPSFRGFRDIIVYVNSWVGEKRRCYLRQAKATFYTMGSPPISTERWNYHASLSIPEKGVFRVSLLPRPNTTYHDVRLCKGSSDDIYDRTFKCKSRILRGRQNITTFKFKVQHCASYCLQIVPEPNHHRERYQINWFLPALECPLCERTDNDMMVKPAVNVQTIALITGASLVGFVVGIAFVAIKLKTKRKPRPRDVQGKDNFGELLGHNNPNKMQPSESKIQGQFWKYIRAADEKRVCLVFTKDSQCHVKVVDEFVRCLQTYFRCVVCPVNWSQDIRHQLHHAQIVIVVDSSVLANLLKSDTIYSEWGHVLSGQRPSHMMTICDLLKEIFNDKMVVVRFAYTDVQMSKLHESNVTYNIPANLYDLVCSLHDIKITKSSSQVKMKPDDLLTVGLGSAIGAATTCHELSRVNGNTQECACSYTDDGCGEGSHRTQYDHTDYFGSCVTLKSESTSLIGAEPDGNSDDMILPPSPIDEYQFLTSVNSELLAISKLYESRM